jgi:hypothetical protein
MSMTFATTRMQRGPGESRSEHVYIASMVSRPDGP